MKIPILRLEGTLLTSIQVDLTDQDVLQFQADVADKIKETKPRGLVIDITAMEVVDSFIARVLSETARMAGLLGVATVLCGMRPAVALTLVEMGQDLPGVITALNLEQGMEKIRKLNTPVVSRHSPYTDESGNENNQH